MKIFAPNEIIEGSTYGEWTARWWKWAVSIPDSNNLFEATKTNIDLSQNQTESVFFLPGVYGANAPIRRVKVSPGKFIMPTIINFMASDQEFPALGTERDLREAAAFRIDTATNLDAKVDDVEIRDIAQYRFQSPAFYFTVKKDNALYLFPSTQKPVSSTILEKTGPLYRAVADGMYFIMGPIRAGEKVKIQWSAQAALWNEPNYTTSGHYEVTA
jgi:hypothetical protein